MFSVEQKNLSWEIPKVAGKVKKMGTDLFRSINKSVTLLWLRTASKKKRQIGFKPAIQTVLQACAITETYSKTERLVAHKDLE